MPRYIIKLTRGNEARYLEWSTVVDAPVTYGMTLDDFKNYYLKRYGEEQAERLDERLKRVEATGTSSIGYRDLAELLSGNRAGPNEKHLSQEALWDQYCIDDAT